MPNMDDASAHARAIGGHLQSTENSRGPRAGSDAGSSACAVVGRSKSGEPVSVELPNLVVAADEDAGR